jgi:TolA-binding protein
MMIMKRWMMMACLVLIALAMGACTTHLKDDPNAIPEMKLADWKVLRETVQEYEASRVDPDQKNLLFVQQTFRTLLTNHSNNRIGEEALYFVGRIFYDMRAYHDARVTFTRHREFYQNSEFAPAIAKLTEEMDRDQARYRAWLEESRASTPAR